MEQEDGVGGTILGDGGRDDSAAGPSQRTYLAESSATTSAERRTASDSDKEKSEEVSPP